MFSGTLTDNPKETKHVNFINAETQTAIDQKDVSLVEDEAAVIDKSPETTQKDEEQPKNSESPLKIFDDAPLERIRKNRLAALMGSLTGKDPILTPKPTLSSVLNGIHDSQDIEVNTSHSDKITKPLVSILTTNKVGHKSDKHVHFIIPVSSDCTNDENSELLSSELMSDALVTVNSSQSSTKTASCTPAPPSSPVAFKPAELNTFNDEYTSSSTPSLPSTFANKDTILQAKTTTISSNTIVPMQSLSTSITTNPHFSFGTSLTAESPAELSSKVSAPILSSTKPGGFKFDLSPPKVDVSKSLITANIVDSGATGKLLTSLASTLSFGSKPRVSVTTSTGLTFGTITTTSSTGPLSSTSISPFKFGGFNSESNAKPQVGIASVMSKSMSPNTGSEPPTFSFGNITSNSSSLVSSASGPEANRTPAFSFGDTKNNSNTIATTTASTFSFGTPNTPVVITSVNKSDTSIGITSSNSTMSSSSTTTFGTSSSVFENSSLAFGKLNPHGGFGISSPPSSFTTPTTVGIGTTTNAPSGFTSTSVGGFANVTSSSSFEAPITLGVFNTTLTSNTIRTSIASNSFGGSTTSNTFGSSTTTNVFGTSSPGFVPKTSVPPSFGRQNNSQAFGGFEAITTLSRNPGKSDTSTVGYNTSATSIFGSNKSLPTFTPTTTTTSIGFPNPTSTTSFNNGNLVAFGQNGVSAPFGSVTTSSFVGNTFNTTTTASVFGASTGFGNPAPNSGNIFGGTTTTQTSGFGPSNTVFSTPPTQNPFGHTTTSVPSFGSNTAAVFSFGAKATTASGNGFASTNTASTGGFGASVAPPFGTNQNFGISSNNFGGSATFGTGNTTNYGITTSQPNSFGTQSSGFGSSSQGFGTENKQMFGTSNATPVFGATALSTGFVTSNNHNPQSFGPSANSSEFGKPPVNAFAAAGQKSFSSTTGGFGSGQTEANVFGHSNTSTTNAAPVFNFGSGAAAKSGVFSFGSASTSGEPQKPNFNFTAGNPASTFAPSSSFGASRASSFSATNAPQFGPQTGAAPGMFNIGTGSPSARNRPFIRGKRRT